MASTAKELEDWQIISTDSDGNIIDEENNKRRRSRRRGALERIYLRRLSDGLQIGRGDSIIINDKAIDEDGENVTSILFVSDIRLHTLNNIVELWAYSYLKWDELDPIEYYKQFNANILEKNKSEDDYAKLFADEVDKNEIYLTIEPVEVKLADIVSLANIIPMAKWINTSFKKDDKRDYLVRYICTTIGTNFSPIDIIVEKERIIRKTPKETEEHLKDILWPERKDEPKKKKSYVPRNKTSAKPKKIKMEDTSVSEIPIDSSTEEGDEDSEDDVYTGGEEEGVEDSNEEEDDDIESAEEAEDVDEDEEENNIKPKKRGRPAGRPRKVKIEKTGGSLNTSKSGRSTLTVRKFTKKNVVRAKKKYTPFSKRYKSIAAIPDLTKLSEFHQHSTDLLARGLENRLKTTQKHQIVETIFSKIKKQLYSSHNREELLNSGDLGNYLPARDNEFETIYFTIYSALESSSATTLYVHGTPGVGKTLTIREAMRNLQAFVKQDMLPSFQYVEINGLKMVKPTDAYEVLWNKISGESLTWGAAMESLEFFFKKVPKNKKLPIVVLLDELDALVNKAQDILYNFFNWTTYENAKLIVIAVSNTNDLPEKELGNKVSSRIGFTRIIFSGYTHEQLKTIIDFRLKGLNDSYFFVDTRTGSAYLADSSVTSSSDRLPAGMKKVRLRMTDDAIEIASRKVASVSGDARRALKVCKRAAEIAEQYYMAKHGYGYDGQTIVSEDLEEGERENAVASAKDSADVQTVHISHVMKALNETINSHAINFMSRLSFTAKLFLFALLNLIKKSGLQEQSLGNVIDEIRLLIEVNGNNKFIVGIVDTLFQKNESNKGEQLRMISWDFLINQLVDGGIIVKQNIKNERLSCVKLNVSIEDVKQAVYEDEALKGL